MAPTSCWPRQPEGRKHAAAGFARIGRAARSVGRALVDGGAPAVGRGLRVVLAACCRVSVRVFLWAGGWGRVHQGLKHDEGTESSLFSPLGEGDLSRVLVLPEITPTSGIRWERIVLGTPPRLAGSTRGHPSAWRSSGRPLVRPPGGRYPRAPGVLRRPGGGAPAATRGDRRGARCMCDSCMRVMCTTRPATAHLL